MKVESDVGPRVKAMWHDKVKLCFDLLSLLKEASLNRARQPSYSTRISLLCGLHL